LNDDPQKQPYRILVYSILVDLFRRVSRDEWTRSEKGLHG